MRRLLPRLRLARECSLLHMGTVFGASSSTWKVRPTFHGAGEDRLLSWSETNFLLEVHDLEWLSTQHRVGDWAALKVGGSGNHLETQLHRIFYVYVLRMP